MTDSLSFLVIEIKADMFSFVILAIEQRLTDLALKHLFCMVWSNSWSPLTGMEKVANVCVQVLVWSVTLSSSFSSFPPFSHPHHLSCYCCCCCQSLSHCQNHYCLSLEKGEISQNSYNTFTFKDEEKNQDHLRKIRPSLLSWQNPLEAQSSSSSLWFCYPAAHTWDK